MRLVKLFKEKQKDESGDYVFLCKALRKSVGLSFKTRKQIQKLLDEENKKSED